MGYKLNQLIESARDELRERLEEDLDQDKHDLIHEIADSSVPIYTTDLLDLFTDDPSLAFVGPELGHGTAGDNMVGKAQAIIYEAITAALHDALDEIVEEIEDEIKEEKLKGLRFQLGDRVMVVASEDDRSDQTGIVEDRDPMDDTYTYKVLFEDQDEEWYAEEDLEFPS